MAAALHWPLEVWLLLLQCKLSGKAQEVVAALSLEDSLHYDTVKTTVLWAYELVPEAFSAFSASGTTKKKKHSLYI